MKSLNLAAVCLVLSPALAAGHVHFDIAPAVSAGRIITDGISHLADEDPWTGAAVDPARRFLSPNQRLFEYEFGEDPAFPREAGDPGINREPGTSWTASGAGTILGGTGLPIGSTLSLISTGGLRQWNGDGFDPAAGDAAITLYRSGTSFITITPASSALTLPLKTFTGDDHIHLHLTSELAGGQAGDVFLVEATLASSDPGIIDAQPFWLVYAFQAEEAEHNAAVRWVESHLVPEPSLVGLAGPGLLVLQRRRARRQ